MVITQKEYEDNKKKKIDIQGPQFEDVPDDVYGLFPSSSVPGGYYLISGQGDNLKCSCPQCKIKGNLCKHLKEIKNGNSACLRISGYISEKDGQHP